MNLFEIFLKSKKVQKTLITKPGEEGFSLVELVVVIAVLAILAAVAIPAFNGIQNDAKASAVKSGMANGIKECLVKEARGADLKFADTKAFQGEYNSYKEFKEWDTVATATGASVAGECMAVKAIPQNAYATILPELFMAIDGEGKVYKACELETTGDWNSSTYTNEYCW